MRESMVGWKKVPFRQVYAETYAQWAQACWDCLVATAKWRLAGSPRTNPNGSPAG